MWKDRKEKVLVGLTLLCFVLLLVVKIKVPIIQTLEGTEWHHFFASKPFEEITADVLVGLIAAYIFYVLIDLLPRSRRERSTMKVLNSLIASVVDSYVSCRPFGHELAVNNVSLAVLENSVLEKLMESMNGKITSRKFGQLKFAMFTAESRLFDFRSALILASNLSPEHAMSWLVITDKVKLLSEELTRQPVDEIYQPSDVYGHDDEPEFKGDSFDEYRSDMVAYAASMNLRLFEIIEATILWNKIR